MDILDLNRLFQIFTQANAIPPLLVGIAGRLRVGLVSTEGDEQCEARRWSRPGHQRWQAADCPRSRDCWCIV